MLCKMLSKSIIIKGDGGVGANNGKNGYKRLQGYKLPLVWGLDNRSTVVKWMLWKRYL